MDFAEGGKIDTVLYSAACGALSSVAGADDGPAIRINPTKDAARPLNAEVLSGLQDRSLRLCVDPIRRHTLRQKISRKLSQRFHAAKTGCMIE
jgi:hypothetical protein